jgi:hypothetical protein
MKIHKGIINQIKNEPQKEEFPSKPNKGWVGQLIYTVTFAVVTVVVVFIGLGLSIWSINFFWNRLRELLGWN